MIDLIKFQESRYCKCGNRARYTGMCIKCYNKVHKTENPAICGGIVKDYHDKILGYLKANPGSWISVSEMIRELGLKRSRIYKSGVLTRMKRLGEIDTRLALLEERPIKRYTFKLYKIKEGHNADSPGPNPNVAQEESR